MKISHMILIVMAVTLVAAMPAKSYADPQLDTLVNIATQAKDNLGATISQMSSVPNDISQLYGQGSNETDALTQAAAQQDVGAAKEHFLAAMRFFKETNDKINSLGTASAPTDRQRAQTEDLRGEVVRLENVGRLLKTIAAQNSVPVNFTGFDQMIQAASQDLDSGNLTDASKQVSSANDFIAATHNALNKAAQDRISERAKDFTERQIEQMNQTQTGPAQQNGQQGQGSTGQNPAAQNATAPVQPPGPPQTASPNLPPGGNSNITMSKNPQEMVAQLKKLVAEGKVDQAIALIKMIQAYQHEQLAQKAAELYCSACPEHSARPEPQSSTSSPAAEQPGTAAERHLAAATAELYCSACPEHPTRPEPQSSPSSPAAEQPGTAAERHLAAATAELYCSASTACPKRDGTATEQYHPDATASSNAATKRHRPGSANRAGTATEQYHPDATASSNAAYDPAGIPERHGAVTASAAKSTGSEQRHNHVASTRPS